MSSASRTTTRGGKGGKPETTVGGKSQKSDAKSDSPKALDLNPKIQPTAEQMRIAQIIDTRTEDPDLKDKIKQVMDATRKTEDEVCTALHDCDNDPDRAVNMLLEGMGTGEWEMSGKKKKNRQPGTNAKPEGPVNNREDPGGDWSREREGGGGGSGGVERERSRVRGGGPPRMRGRGSLDSRGWRGRENKENEKNLEDSRGDIPRRGGRMMNGPGGRSGRGGRGGRLGPRTFQNRERGGFPRSIDTWNNPQAEDSTADPIKMENWADDFPSPEDWDNEEYTGSLADTKVFTPSNSVQQASLNPEPLQDSTNQDIASPVPQNISNSLSPNSDQMSQNLELASTLQQNNQTPTVTPNAVGVGVMTQSQYLSQLTQATENLKSAVGIGSNSTPVSNSSQSYGPVSSASTNNYPVTSSAAYHTPSPTAFTSTTDALSASFSTSSFGGSAASYSSQMKVQTSVPPPVSQSSVTQSMPARTKTQRPRVPPPSKIPSTAVEMPGDAINSSISFLDVQFGGLEFGSETSSFDFSTDQSKFSGAATGTSMDSVSNSGTSSAIDLNASNTSKSQSTSLDGYSGSSSQQSSKDHNQSGMSLGQNQKLSGPENIPFPSNQNAEHKPSQPAFSQPRVSGSGSSGMDIGKSDAGLSYSASSTVTYQNSYPNQKPSATVYQAPSSYSTSSGYTSSQVQSSSTPYPSSQAQSSFPQSQSNSGYASQATNSYPSSQASNSAPSYSSAQSVVGGNAVSGSAGSSSSGTGSGSYASSQTSVSSSSSYQTSGSQAVPAPPVSSSAAATSSAYQFETTTTSSSNLSSTIPATTSSALSTNVNVSPALGLPTSSQTVNASNSSSTKVSSSTGKTGGLPNIPPGVPPIMGTHQYIMSQAGMPYFAGVQQPVFSYEDIQLLQQRIPHMQAAGYYDLGYQAPTSLATGREGGLASVAYSVSDGRFARTDNNSSPVPSTLSQQNPSQAHQQPMLNPSALPPGYAYFYGGSMVPAGGFQYGTPAIYPMATATNAHGATNNTQYPKPGSYGSAYGSGYDNLSQNQEYGKTGYVSGNQSQSKGGVGGNSGTAGSSASDLGATMYGKSHVALGKVNSYDKQGFHSGTPPPFNMPGTQTTPMGAPSGAYPPHLFIPTMAPHQQHHSTTLMHQPLHTESGSTSGQRSQSSNQPNKSGGKQGYSASYWANN